MKKIFYILSVLLTTVSCADKVSFVEEDATDTVEKVEQGDIIQIGGLETFGLELSVNSGLTRAGVDAEKINWLVTPLKQGLDITYGKVINGAGDDRRRVAILKLQPGAGDAAYLTDATSGWAIYTFKYRGTEQNALWYDNGAHFFEGVYVPDALRYGTAYTVESGRQELTSVNNKSAKDILTDQSKNGDTDNYTLLSRYLGMPANTHITATLGRIKLPFRHRLARVQAYVLIDPEMQDQGVTLKGFELVDGKDDPNSTSISFNNVEVLSGVHDTQNSDGTHVLTPQWVSQRKVIPHFVGMRGSLDGNETSLDENFIMYYNDKTQSYFFPTDETGKWDEYHKMTDASLVTNKIDKTVYNKVPVYDLIVRPTYTSADSVMYDEDLTNITKQQLETKKNSIEFELTLSNGLVYTKHFEFDLDANYQTVVYLRIGRESVDYNASGSALWVTDPAYHDDWYGVDNTGLHSLSKAGSSWQRAYTFGSTLSGDNVTDGGYYNESNHDEDGVDGQYLTAATWIKKFAQAHEEGAHHGDYFILTDNIEIDASLLPEDFVFTGHLDAQDHTITLTNAGKSWTEWKVADSYPADGVFYKSESMEERFYMPSLFVHHEKVEEVSHSATEEDVAAGKAENVGDKVIDTSAADESYESVSINLTTLMASDPGTYFTRTGEEGNYTYTNYVKPEKLYILIPHTYGSALFAGLNGIYTATAGVANVHSENGVLVPYADETTGWRAEVLNLVVNGKLFPDGDGGVYTYSTGESPARNGYNLTKVNGNVQNCQDSQGKVPNHTPALFKY